MVNWGRMELTNFPSKSSGLSLLLMHRMYFASRKADSPSLASVHMGPDWIWPCGLISHAANTSLIHVARPSPLSALRLYSVVPDTRTLLWICGKCKPVVQTSHSTDASCRGNVKLPLYRSIENSTSDEWKTVPQSANQNITYASLIGIPVLGLSDGTSNFTIKARQWDVTCSSNKEVDKEVNERITQ